MSSERSLTKDFWHCLRLWLFDYHYENGDNPFAETTDYNFSAIVFHALSHWKHWLSLQPQFQGRTLKAHYKWSYWGEGLDFEYHFPPDAGEFKRHDYLLFDEDRNIITAVESEYGKEIKHLLEDLPKLVEVQSRLKVMIYRMPSARSQSIEISFTERIQAIEQMLSEHLKIHDSTSITEEWLFIGVPWYKNGTWPKNPAETLVRVHLLTTPTEKPVKLIESNWDLWDDASSMDTFIRSIYRNESKSQSSDFRSLENQYPGWYVRRRGYKWSREVFDQRVEQAPEKIEFVGGIFDSDEKRMTVLGMLLENLGIDRAIEFGNLADWKEAIAELEDKRNYE